MTALHDLAAECDAVNRANLWDASTIDNLPGKLAFLFTETILEAHEEQDNGSHAVHIEIADAAVRILASLSGIWGARWEDRVQFRHVYCRTAYAPLETLLLPANIHVCRALQAWRKDKQDDVRAALELAVLELYRLSDRMGFDLSATISAKLDVNRKRGPRHGNVRGLG